VIVGHDIQHDFQALQYQHPLKLVRDSALHYRADRCHELGLVGLPAWQVNEKYKLKPLVEAVFGTKIQEGGL
jgi:hypothetical protein